MNIIEKLKSIGKKEKGDTSSSLRKRMVFYFLLIAIANVFVAGEILVEIKSTHFRQKVAGEVELIKEGKEPVTHIYKTFDNLSRKFIIMILILIIVSAVVLFMFVWQIASPIQYMINQAEQMANGNLSIRIDIKKEDEIAILGKLINDLSINLQEVIAQLERLVHEERSIVTDFSHDLEERPIRLSMIKKHLVSMDDAVKKLEMLKDAFVLYTIESLRSNIDEMKNR